MARADTAGRATSRERRQLRPPIVADAHHLPHLRPADPSTCRTSADPGHAAAPGGILSPGIGGADRMALLPNGAQPDADGPTSHTGPGQVTVATPPRAERGRIGSTDSRQHPRREPERPPSGLARDREQSVSRTRTESGNMGTNEAVRPPKHKQKRTQTLGSRREPRLARRPC